MKISVERLRQRLSANFETGELTWLYAPDLNKTWNTRFAGKPAFRGKGRHGYRIGSIDDCPLFAHRVLWALFTGEWPKGDIDHINGVVSDNRLLNLRDVPHRDNQRNMRIHKSNTSGVAGVNWHRRDRRWRAFIEIDGKSIHLGNYKEMGAAVAARKEAEKKYGFHSLHGSLKAW